MSRFLDKNLCQILLTQYHKFTTYLLARFDPGELSVILFCHDTILSSFNGKYNLSNKSPIPLREEPPGRTCPKSNQHAPLDFTSLHSSISSENISLFNPRMNNVNRNNTFEHLGSAHVLMFDIVTDYFANPHDAFEFIRHANSRIDAFINQNIQHYPTRASQDEFRQHTLQEARNIALRFTTTGQQPIRQTNNGRHSTVAFPRLHGPGQQAQPAQLQIPDILPPTNAPANNNVVTLGSTTAQSTTTNCNPPKKFGIRYEPIPGCAFVALCPKEALSMFRSRYGCKTLKQPASLVKVPGSACHYKTKEGKKITMRT
jgi:hypothetical protein